MTARRKAALRKAQLASARKRRGGKSRRRISRRAGILAMIGGGAIVTGMKYKPYGFKDYRQGERFNVRWDVQRVNGKFSHRQFGFEFGRGRNLYGFGLGSRKNSSGQKIKTRLWDDFTFDGRKKKDIKGFKRDVRRTIRNL